MNDTTPLWVLIAVAVIVWTVALIVMWRAIHRAPEVSGDAAMTDDDRWAERALFDYDLETMAR